MSHHNELNTLSFLEPEDLSMKPYVIAVSIILTAILNEIKLLKQLGSFVEGYIMNITKQYA